MPVCPSLHHVSESTQNTNCYRSTLGIIGKIIHAAKWSLIDFPINPTFTSKLKLYRFTAGTVETEKSVLRNTCLSNYFFSHINETFLASKNGFLITMTALTPSFQMRPSQTPQAPLKLRTWQFCADYHIYAYNCTSKPTTPIFKLMSHWQIVHQNNTFYFTWYSFDNHGTKI